MPNIILHHKNKVYANTFPKINGMGGEHCVMVIKNIVSKIDGAKINHFEVGNAAIELDESKTFKTNVVTSIETMGYKVS